MDMGNLDICHNKFFITRSSLIALHPLKWTLLQTLRFLTLATKNSVMLPSNSLVA